MPRRATNKPNTLTRDFNHPLRKKLQSSAYPVLPKFPEMAKQGARQPIPNGQYIETENSKNATRGEPYLSPAATTERNTKHRGRFLRQTQHKSLHSRDSAPPNPSKASPKAEIQHLSTRNSTRKLESQPHQTPPCLSLHPTNEAPKLSYPSTTSHSLDITSQDLTGPHMTSHRLRPQPQTLHSNLEIPTTQL